MAIVMFSFNVLARYTGMVKKKKALKKYIKKFGLGKKMTDGSRLYTPRDEHVVREYRRKKFEKKGQAEQV